MPSAPSPARTRRSLLLWGLLLVAALNQWPRPFPEPVVTTTNDLDGLRKLQGIERDRHFTQALGYFLGDDPQRVHTFRPLPALLLWLEFQWFGYHSMPYRLLGWVWFVVTGWALVRLCLAFGMPWVPAWACGLLLLANPTRGSAGVLASVATLHDLMAVLFCLLALEALFRYLQAPRGRLLLAYAAWSLLAYLSKEMALALVPLTVIYGSIQWRRGASRRAAGAGVLAALGVALVWLVWRGVAEVHMVSAADPAHSVSGWLMLLTERWPRALWFLASSLCWSAADLYRQFCVDVDWTILLCEVFWRSSFMLAGFVAMFVVLARQRPHWLLVLYTWKLLAFLPVLPLSDTFPWYLYMPHVLDPILPVGAVWCWWTELSGREWAARKWQGILAQFRRDRLQPVG